MGLDRIRTVLGLLNLREVARGSGIHPNTLYRIANGGGAQYETVRKLLDYLNKMGWR